MQRLLLSYALLVVTALAAAAPRAQAEVIERVVAVVDEDVILLSELRRRAVPFLEQTLAGAGSEAEKRKRVNNLYKQLLDQLIDELLVQKTAREMRVTVTKLEVDQAIDKVRSQNNLSAERFWDVVRSQGYTEQQYREDLRKQLLRLKVTNQKVRARINVADEDVQERYEEDVRKARRTLRFRAAHIFLQLPAGAPATEVARTRQRAKALSTELNASNFDAAMKEHGGGDLGWLSQGDLPEALERALASLEPGQISEPVRGPSGVHIFLLRERQRSSEMLPAFKDVKESIRQQMLERAMGRQQQVFIDQLRRKAVIDIRL